MRLIIQKIGGKVYASVETESHFKRASKGRRTKSLDPKLLGKDCDLDNMPEGHFVFRIRQTRSF